MLVVDTGPGMAALTTSGEIRRTLPFMWRALSATSPNGTATSSGSSRHSHLDRRHPVARHQTHLELLLRAVDAATTLTGDQQPRDPAPLDHRQRASPPRLLVVPTTAISTRPRRAAAPPARGARDSGSPSRTPTRRRSVGAHGNDVADAQALPTLVRLDPGSGPPAPPPSRRVRATGALLDRREVGHVRVGSTRGGPRGLPPAGDAAPCAPLRRRRPASTARILCLVVGVGRRGALLAIAVWYAWVLRSTRSDPRASRGSRRRLTWLRSDYPHQIDLVLQRADWGEITAAQRSRADQRPRAPLRGGGLRHRRPDDDAHRPHGSGKRLTPVADVVGTLYPGEFGRARPAPSTGRRRRPRRWSRDQPEVPLVLSVGLLVAPSGRMPWTAPSVAAGVGRPPPIATRSA